MIVEQEIKLPVDYTKLKRFEKKKVREEYIKIQNGLCTYCNELLSGQPPERILSKKINRRLFPEGFFEAPIHLHHDHKTSMTIGAIHAYCNAYLWEYHGI